MEKIDKKILWIIIALVVILLVCICAGVIIVRASGYALLAMSETNTTTEEVETNSEFPSQVKTARAGSYETLQTLQNAIVPTSNLNDLAFRLKGIANIPQTMETPVFPLQTGAEQQFWVNDSNTDKNFQITATLRYVTPHAYFWFQNGLNYNENDLKNLAERDALTKAFNRHALETVLIDRLNEAEDKNLVSCISIVDIDGFKMINDTYGHEVGDSVLKW